ncbi:hypothetical protein [Schlesneria paludicola]|uniref:hypothetical protein n=1 Tax=Schlesneria paludicola TaxID=360056 RepID=UPI00029ACCB5|nr:hypothetical protein [Schlesneria paludicola]
MLIEFQCRCGHEFRTKPENAGRSIVCPNCLAHNVVPDASATCVELPSHDEQRSLAPLVRRANETDQAEQTGSDTPHRQLDHAAKNRRLPPIPQASSRSKRHNNTSAPDDADSRGPSDNFEQLDEWTSPRRRRRKADDDGESPAGKRGKRPSSKTKREGGSNVFLVIGGTVTALVLIGSLAFFAVPILAKALKDGGKVQTPQEFEKYEDNDFHFRCEIPKGWDVEGRGGSGNVPPSVRIEQGRVKIVYRSSQSGAAIQDMAQAQANMVGGDVSDELQPVSRVHDYQGEKFSSDLTNYKEIGEAEKIETGWGEGRLSTFTASSGLNGTIYGYRVTLLTSQFQWNVVCQCPTRREFLAYQPTFRRIITSTGR